MSKTRVGGACVLVWLLGCSGDDTSGTSSTEATDDSDTSGSTCQEDGVANGEETDVDCGGFMCPTCGLGQTCLLNGDCESGACVDSVCAAPSCTDGGKNQDETGVDCGGSCPPCGTGEYCNGPGDCQSGKCMGGSCDPPTCDDGIENGNESDVDCGGTQCAGCPDGRGCNDNPDCASAYCADGTCAAKSCESDPDCSDLTTACADGVCSMEDFNCQAVPKVDCSDLDDQCVVGVCDPQDGTCKTDPINEDGVCDDADPCTADELCQAGACVDPDGQDLHLVETFADDSGGWTLGENWEIATATESPSGEAGTGKDPGQDHTATDDNGVAGVFVGGLTSGSQSFTYLESPSVDLESAAGPLTFSLWRWLNSDVDPKMQSVIEVRDGNSWATVWQNDGDAVVADDAWTLQEFDVTDYKSSDFRVRIGYKATGAAADVGGWNVDDVLVAPPNCVP